MARRKSKIAALAGVGILLASGTAIVVVKSMRPATPRIVSPAAQSDPATDRIWDQYSQVFAQNLRGQPGFDAVVQVMTNHPPMAMIWPSPAQGPGRQRVGGAGMLQSMGTAQGHVAMAAWLVPVLRYAYDLDPQFPQNRIIVPNDLADSRFDYIDTMPRGGTAILRQALKAQFGVVAKRETRANLVLTVKNPATGLRKHTEADASEFRSLNMTIPELANRLGRLLGVDVADQTGLSGGFDFTFNLPPGSTAEDIKAAVLIQLGLGLTPAADNQPVVFLVAEKAQ